ncbi:MAG: hypothetical protein UR39_C0008G0013 [Candidatus Woesebacteria bacterium GW2011_GWA1_33_30]|uniref:Uncharacterized protein n=1 Tax=Candidatus Woesebacteria bacterium GW2011_GWA2_33_28 TaxID=1618561 RepID=A0A0G0A639_9BACT|nr:MAG: hypothetical protein UR38_C0008G0012 [Candidatus Woesebacteria bacterium GW2011_GWA2_33_28]KKP47568.1 MAG: hypothetical protein UR39_C0008G0013 [Candidatus Woesebacteria bacterium GW2011_GWA1_33_30]KKP49189.1 MAG: hypothetical protein UR40_C0009G0012 [Microgenomates group bacterium GW2011_GWC1_33_32]KKP51681.1 MAG: hypothetical protein UR44_C0007G0012 [Candidatus Woesebacteria bacterium GW2011_GWB1_33_38]KKP55701.1 MAG: hypothetical protein UR48_C0054G0009 [Microgenomates group bacteriu
MTKQSIILRLGALVVGTGILAITASSTLAYRGDPNVKGPNYTAERHTAMLKAFENKDFNAWSNLMQGKGRVTQVVNKDNFAKFAEAHELSLNGKTDEAQKIRAELGLGLQNGAGKGQGMGRFAR